MKKIKPAWCFDSPDDYYEQFEDLAQTKKMCQMRKSAH